MTEPEMAGPEMTGPELGRPEAGRSDQPRVRASDAERERVAAAVREAMGEGRLDLAEGEERLARVYAATYRDELPGLTADLPGGGDTGPDPGRWSRRDQGRGGARGGWGPAGAGGPREAWARRRRGRPAFGLVALLAVGAGVWALASGGPFWPAVVLGIVALVVAKRRWYAHYAAMAGTAGHAAAHPAGRPGGPGPGGCGPWHRAAACGTGSGQTAERV